MAAKDYSENGMESVVTSVLNWLIPPDSLEDDRNCMTTNHQSPINLPESTTHCGKDHAHKDINKIDQSNIHTEQPVQYHIPRHAIRAGLAGKKEHIGKKSELHAKIDSSKGEEKDTNTKYSHPHLTNYSHADKASKPITSVDIHHTGTNPIPRQIHSSQGDINIRGKGHSSLSSSRNRADSNKRYSQEQPAMSMGILGDLLEKTRLTFGSSDHHKPKHGSTVKKRVSMEKDNTVTSCKVLETPAQIKERKLEEERMMLDFPGWACVELDTKSNIVSPDMARMIAQHLPHTVQDRNWIMVYSTYEHGTSLQSLYRKCQAYGGPCVLIVREDSAHVFGAYTNQCIQLTNDKYLGNGECFIYQLLPKLKIYSWTNKNRYMLMGAEKSFHFGSGGGTYGLWVNDELRQGQSQRCETYANDPLGSDEFFTISGIEVWGFEGAHSYPP